MARRGYAGVDYYYMGLNGSESHHFIGWGGNYFEDPYLLLENFTTISSKTIGLNNSISEWEDTFYAIFYTSNSSDDGVPARVKVLLRQRKN